MLVDANAVLNFKEAKNNSMTEPAAWTARPKSLQKLTLRDKAWRYQGEGNANVVLSIPADGTVVRVMKEGDDGGETTEAAAEKLYAQLRFCDTVRRTFFGGGGGRHVDVPVPMSMSTEELREIDRVIRPHRPPGRKHKGLGLAGCLVAVCPNYTALPPTDVPGVWCVEIKPKQGWVHVDDVAADSPDEVRTKCPFCAHQYLKLYRGDVQRPSGYCPLDMFSGRRERVRRAVRALLWDPQNNLKIFLDGAPLAAPDDGFGAAAREALGSVRRFCALVAGALLGDFEGGRDAPVDGRDGLENDSDEEEEHRSATSGAVPPESCDFAGAVPMPQYCVLHEILTMQQMQTTGFAAVCTEYDGRHPRSPQFGHVDRLRPNKDGDDDAWTPVDGYLVAATARDCSVYVTFRRPDSSLTEIRVKVSDLDPKPLSTVDKHRNRNANVSLACRQYLTGNSAHHDPSFEVGRKSEK